MSRGGRAGIVGAMTNNDITNQIRQFRRSRSDRMISGVCGGAAKMFGVDPTIVRLLFVALALLGGGTGVLLYLICWIVVPEED